MGFCNVPGCYRFGGYCPQHGATTRTSDKKEREKLYPKIRDKYLEDNPICEVEGCNERATEVHHKRGRGIFLIVVEWFMAVCRKHHRRITDDTAWAKANGYIVSRLKKDK